MKKILMYLRLIALPVMPTQAFAAGGSDTVTVRIDYVDQDSGAALSLADFFNMKGPSAVLPLPMQNGECKCSISSLLVTFA
ncbi:MAG: hypothetical protein ACOX41_10325 [Anaerovoracaceae bacterium]|jgi:hypothetical protein